MYALAFSTTTYTVVRSIPILLNTCSKSVGHSVLYPYAWVLVGNSLCIQKGVKDIKDNRIKVMSKMCGSEIVNAQEWVEAHWLKRGDDGWGSQILEKDYFHSCSWHLSPTDCAMISVYNDPPQFVRSTGHNHHAHSYLYSYYHYHHYSNISSSIIIVIIVPITTMIALLLLWTCHLKFPHMKSHVAVYKSVSSHLYISFTGKNLCGQNILPLFITAVWMVNQDLKHSQDWNFNHVLTLSGIHNRHKQPSIHSKIQ